MQLTRLIRKNTIGHPPKQFGVKNPTVLFLTIPRVKRVRVCFLRAHPLLLKSVTLPLLSSLRRPGPQPRPDCPLFLESENEIILPDDHDNSTTQVPLAQFVPGEGTLFGFHASQQFDGHSEDMRRSLTPPPSLEMANRDTDLTPLTDLSESTHAAIEALNLVLEQTEQGRDEEREQLPPPPPAMDDPLDPPPSIDSDFRSPVVARHTPPSRSSPPPSRPPYHPAEPPRLHTPTSVAPSESAQSSDGHAPPPYLTPHHDQEHVARPPPYVD